MTAHTQSRTQARSMVVSQGGIVAAESPLAAQAGAMILAHGGNAVDAAVATNAAMGVLEPMMNGIGGDLFAIVYEAKTGKLYGLNASGWAPAKLSIESLHAKGDDKMPPEWHRFRHRSRRRGWLVQTSLASRNQKISRSSRARHSLCKGRISRT